MLRFSIWVISLLTLFSTISTQDSIWHNKLPDYASNDRVHTSRTGRFDLGILNNIHNIHKEICQALCKSVERLQYFTYFLFVLKCPPCYFPNCSKTTTPISTPTLTPPVQTTTTSTAAPMTEPNVTMNAPTAITTVNPSPTTTTMNPTTTTTTTTPSTTSSSTTSSSTTTTTPSSMQMG